MTSLRTRLLIAVGALAVAAVSAVAIAVRHETRQEFLRFEDRERRTASAHVADQAGAIARLLDGQCCDASLRTAAARLGLGPDQVLLIVDRDDGGRLVSAAGTPLDAMPSIATRYEGQALVIESTRRVNGTLTQVQLKLLQQGAAIHLSNGHTALLYILPMPSTDREGSAALFLGSLDRRVLLITIAVALCALLATWMIARGVTGPLRDLQSATHALAHGDLARRIILRGTGSREVRELGGAFNQMADALERQATLRQDLIRDVAHELRTPLTAVRCRIDAVLDGLSPHPDVALKGLLDDVRHLERLVDDLQDTALAEAGELRLTIEDLSLSEVVHSALSTADLESDPRVRVRIDAAAACVRGDAVRVRQILLNLLTNASRYTPPDGTITVRSAFASDTTESDALASDASKSDASKSDASESDHVIVEVHNSGSHLSPDQLARVFDRFYRTDPSRVRASGGSGLGLAIVKHLVEAQHGRVWATSDDAGVTVGFTLPGTQCSAASSALSQAHPAQEEDTARGS
jgi:signal transduction histidine kinase